MGDATATNVVIGAGSGMGEAVATVDGELACRGDLMFAFTEWPGGAGMAPAEGTPAPGT